MLRFRGHVVERAGLNVGLQVWGLGYRAQCRPAGFRALIGSGEPVHQQGLGLQV